MADTEFASSPEKRVRDLDREYVLHSWSVQSQINPLPVAGAQGRHFWDYEGKRYLDFCSQLVNLNLGHQHPAVVEAIVEQAKTLCTIAPSLANDKRSELASLLAEITPGNLKMSFFTNGGAEANENAIKLARWYTGRHKYRSLPLLPRRHGRRRHAHGRPAALARRTRPSGRGAHARSLHVPLSGRPSQPCPVCAGGPHLEEILQFEGPHRGRRDPRECHRHQRRHRAARRLPALDPRGL